MWKSIWNVSTSLFHNWYENSYFPHCATVVLLKEKVCCSLLVIRFLSCWDVALDGIDVLLFLGCKSTIFYKEQCLENRKLFCWPLLVDTQKCRLKVVFWRKWLKISLVELQHIWGQILLKKWKLIPKSIDKKAPLQ